VNEMSVKNFEGQVENSSTIILDLRGNRTAFFDSHRRNPRHPRPSLLVDNVNYFTDPNDHRAMLSHVLLDGGLEPQKTNGHGNCNWLR
jgi:hypothetical protein